MEEKAAKIRIEYESYLEKIEELEEEIEELKSEMEEKITEIKENGERRIQEIQDYYTGLIRKVRKDLDDFIDMRDEHFEILEKFYETVIQTELNYHKAPIEHRLNTLRSAYSDFVSTVEYLEKSHKQFIWNLGPIKLNVPVKTPTLLYLPVWVIVSERGDKKFISLSVVNKSKKGYHLVPLPSLSEQLEGFLKSLKLDLLREAEKENPDKVMKVGLKNLDRLVKRGILTEKEVEKIRKALGG
ncbi:hypothetical protein [Thermococcus sp.]|uniref:hypothetical protein n=1 Tax=Thermococcus sp. TaxID=35749 RepID=UPI002613E624|nr:hypothetical protein [Thermococcus sp.]